MILQALDAYYHRKAGEGDIAPLGWEHKAIPFIIRLHQDGRFAGLWDTRADAKDRGREFLVPRSEIRTSGIKPNLLWDNLGYVFGPRLLTRQIGWLQAQIHALEGVQDPKADKTREKLEKQLARLESGAEKERRKLADKHQAFIQRLENLPPPVRDDAGVKAVRRFLHEHLDEFGDGDWQRLLENDSADVTFQLAGDEELVCHHPQVKTYIDAQAQVMDIQAVMGQCLISGHVAPVARTHDKIKGVAGAQSSGAALVSFNDPAYTSYGKSQNLNAPVSEQAAFAYVTALNHLLRHDSPHKLRVGDTTMVFWTAADHPIIDAIALLFGGEAESGSDSVRDLDSIRALLLSPKTGARPVLEDQTEFYVLGLAPNASRLSVRFWHRATVAEMAGRFLRYFDEIALIMPPNWQPFPPLARLLNSLALQHKSENLPPQLVGAFLRAIFEGTPYPRSALQQAVGRNRAEQDVFPYRAALIKAVLMRTYHHEDLTMSLDPHRSDPGYCLGRLFAVLEKIQEEASPGLNATIKDRYYGAASSTPVTVFSRLLSLKNHHLAKLENRGRATNLEKWIGEIMDKIDAFPPTLSLEQQGLFAIGY